MFEELLSRLARAFSENKVSYMVIGGQAVLVYGEPRLTRDIDITLGLTPEFTSQIVELCRDIGLIPLIADPEKFTRRTFVLPVKDQESDIRVDLIFSLSEYERQALKRAKPLPIGKTSVNIASVEDLIIHKIIASRPRDLEDVQKILLKNPDFDLKYVEKWLTRLEEATGQDYLTVFKEVLKNSK